MTRLIATLALVAAGVFAFTVPTRKAVASIPNCEAQNGPPALCYEWTVASRQIGRGIYQQYCEQVPIPASAEQFCTNKLACVNNGLCDGSGGCAPNPNIENSRMVCMPTSTAIGDDYQCGCENDLCYAASPTDFIYPASTTWCTHN